MTGRCRIPVRALLAATLAACLAGCPSGPYGSRPVATFDTPATEGTGGAITLHFAVTDADLSIIDVLVECSADGGVWTPATLASCAPGRLRGATIEDVRGRAEGVAFRATWDSWADRVGRTGTAEVLVRLTPRDIDGVGEPVVLAAPIAVDNHFPELVVVEGGVDFGTRLAGVAEKPVDERHLTIRNGAGADGTTLYWEVASSESWLKVTPASATAPGIPPYESTVTLTADVDGAGLAAQAAPYAAILTVTGKDTNVAGEPAYGSPRQITATLRVRNPEAEVFVHNGDGSTEVFSLPEFVMEYGGPNPAEQSFHVMNAGDEGTTLAWSATDDLSAPETDWLVGLDGATGGELTHGASEEVAVAVDGSGLTPGQYTATIAVAGTEKTSGAAARGSPRTVAVSLKVTLPPGPAIALSPTTLSPTCVQGMNAASQTFTVRNSDSETLSYTISDNVAWLACSPASGTSTGESHTITVTYTTSGLAVGTHTATITATDAAAANSPQTVAVTLFVYDAESGYKIVDLATGGVTEAASIPDLETNEAYKTTHLVLKLIPPGTFQMGNQVSSTDSDELPVHTVNITHAFYMGVFEVTQQQWTTIEGSWTFYFRGNPKRPAELVSWNDIKQSGGFMDTLSSLASSSGMSFRLPTEAEWEYCCKAGTSTNYSYGDAANGAWMWYADNSDTGSGRQTHDVGTTTSKPNPWGLYDMHGNVWEWCEDWYHSWYYTSSPSDDPPGPTSGSFRVLRGGSWYLNAGACRSADRDAWVPSDRYASIGFRVAVAAAGP